MKASELRIGNYHYYKMIDIYDGGKQSLELYNIDITDLQLLTDHLNHTNFIPVELTEQWLIDFGFQIGYTEKLYWNGLFKIITKDDKYYIIVGNKKIHLLNVHHLQNLHFALTGIELTKKI